MHRKSTDIFRYTETIGKPESQKEVLMIAFIAGGETVVHLTGSGDGSCPGLRPAAATVLARGSAPGNGDGS